MHRKIPTLKELQHQILATIEIQIFFYLGSYAQQYIHNEIKELQNLFSVTAITNMRYVPSPRDSIFLLREMHPIFYNTPI